MFSCMKDPHNYRKVGYSMIVVSASLAAIALLGLAIGEDVLYGDNIQRAKTAEFQNCKEANFVGDECKKYEIYIAYEKCIAEQDLESKECFQFRTWVESDIFEECRANNDMESPKCQQYISRYDP